MSMKFNRKFYLNNNKDLLTESLKNSAFDAEAHYNLFGFAELRNPNKDFNTEFYVTQNPDVRTNPLTHFFDFGADEGRLPKLGFQPKATFDTETYATKNPDLAKAGITTADALYAHFATYGYSETRTGVQTKAGIAIVEGTAGGAVGTTFALTAGFDSTNVLGTANNDTYIGTVNAVAAQSTMAIGDAFDGKGGVDVLNITQNTGGAIGGTATNIETININQALAGAANTSTLNALSGTPNATSINSTGSGSVTITNLGAATELGMIGMQTTGGVAATLTATQTTNGAMVLNLNGASGLAARALTFVDAGAATSMTINSTGTASVLQGITLPGATTLTVNAAANVTLGGVTAAALTTIKASGVAAGTVNVGQLNSILVTAIDASGLTVGGMNVTLANGNAAGVTFKGGAGNDTINLGNTVITGSAGQIAGNKGTGDTLGITLATQLTASLGATAYTGFETLSVAGAGQNYNVSRLAGITDVTMNTGAAANTTTISGLTALAPQNVTLVGTGQAVITVTNAALQSTNDTLNMTFGGVVANAAVTAASLSVAGIENLNITSATGTGATTVTALAAAGNLREIDVEGGASALNFASTAIAIGSGLSFVSKGSGVHIVNFAGATGSAIGITTGEGNDQITGTGLADVLKGNGGNDTLTGGLGADRMTGDAGNDTFVIATAVPGTQIVADDIRDFTSGSDLISFNTNTTSLAGSAANYLEATATVATYALALAAANVALNNVVQYSVQQVGSNTFVFVDGDLDGALTSDTDDFVVQLTGVALTGIAQADIIA